MVVRRELIACQLPAYELVVRHIGVERLDQEVAVVVGMRPVVVLLVTVRLGKPRHVHPMPCPALAVVRTGQQMLDQLTVGGIVDFSSALWRL
jgi:hypothetical protein